MEYLPAKHILIRNKSADWFGTDHTINLYRGCCHGCIYCDSRSDCYGIQEFDQVRVKADALRILRNDLERKVRPGIAGLGSMSDPYNPLEEELGLTRRAIDLLDAYGFGTAIATKSDLIVRDIDILALMREHVPVICKITVTTAEEKLAAVIEPQAPTPARRFAAIRRLSEAGIFTGVLLMPVLPFLEDTTEQVLEVVRQAAEAGARFVYPAFGMTLRQNQRMHYLAALERLFPEAGPAERYRRFYGDRYWCVSPNAKKLWEAFRTACGQMGLLYEMKHITAAYQHGYCDRQLSFFP